MENDLLFTFTRTLLLYLFAFTICPSLRLRQTPSLPLIERSPITQTPFKSATGTRQKEHSRAARQWGQGLVFTHYFYLGPSYFFLTQSLGCSMVGASVSLRYPCRQGYELIIQLSGLNQKSTDSGRPDIHCRSAGCSGRPLVCRSSSVVGRSLNLHV